MIDTFWKLNVLQVTIVLLPGLDSVTKKNSTTHDAISVISNKTNTSNERELIVESNDGIENTFWCCYSTLNST